MHKLALVVALLLVVGLTGPAAAVPTQPVVTDDGAMTPYVHRLHAAWSASDPAGTISYYECAIGLAPYPNPGWDLVTGGWRNVGLVSEKTFTDVVLSHTRTYYFAVRATNTAGAKGPVGVSDGIALQLPTARDFTTTADFALGESSGLTDAVPDQLSLGTVSQTEPYIWIANHTIGRVTKIDTRTGAILAQYYSTRPPASVLPDNLTGQIAIPSPGSNQQSPSRTAVDLDGNVFVANRAHVSSNQQGSVTKIAGSLAYAIDRNGNGRIDTSTGYNDVQQEDECVLWTAKVGKPGTIPRGVAVDAENNVWVATYTDAVLYRFNGATGELIQTIDVKAETGNSAIQFYGIAMGRDGVIYGTSIDSKWATRIDPNAPQGNRVRTVQTFFQGYGIAVNDGLEYIGRWEPGGETSLQIIDWREDPAKVYYCPSPYSGRTRGVAVDGEGNVWVSHFDANRLLKFSWDGIYLNSYPVASGPIGAAVDADGMIWAVGGTSNACTRINPTNGDRADFTAGGEPYSYSDMTGFQLRNFGARAGSWQVVCDAGGNGATWPTISYNGLQPPGTILQVEARAADSTLGLQTNHWIYVNSGAPMSGVSGRFLQVKVTFRIITGDVSPVLHDLTVGSPLAAELPPLANIPDAKKVLEGTRLRLADKKVTYAGSGFFYIEESARHSGIRVQSSDPVLVGDSVTIEGTAATIGGERQLVDACIVSATPGAPLSPVFMNAARVGGSDFGYQPATTPETLTSASLRLWLSADSVNTPDGQHVDVWRDLSGNSLHVSQSDVNWQPVLVAGGLNGQPVLRFDGSDGFVRSSVLGSLLTSKDQANVFVVIKQAGSDPRNTIIGWGNNPERLLFHTTYDNLLSWQHGDPNGGSLLNVTQPAGWDDSWQLAEGYRNGAGAEVRVGGQSLATGTFTDTPDIAASFPLYIGTDYAGNAFTGDVAEILIYDRALSDAERNAVSTYLAEKYAVPYADPGMPLPSSSPGLNTTGLFVKVEGRIVDDKPNWLFVDDGSIPSGRLRVAKAAATANLAIGDRVELTGVCSVVNVGPNLCPVLMPISVEATGADEFDASTLAPYWSLIRPDAAYWSLTSNPGFLRLDATGTDLWQGTNNLKNLLVRSIPGSRWSIQTVISGNPVQNWQQAGLLAYQDDNNYLRFEFQWGDGLSASYVKEVAGGTSSGGIALPTGTTNVYFRLDRDGTSYAIYYKLVESDPWAKIADITGLDLGNPRVGLFALKGSGDSAPYNPFLFDYFLWASY